MARLRIPVPIRWSDLDAYGHVNNAAMLSILEEARIVAFWTESTGRVDTLPTAVLAAGPGEALATLVARQEIEYVAAIPFGREPLVVELWVGRVSGASLEVYYEVIDPSTGAVAVRAATTLVLVEAQSASPRRMSDEARQAWQPYVEEPIVFRRRPR